MSHEGRRQSYARVGMDLLRVPGIVRRSGIRRNTSTNMWNRKGARGYTLE